VPNQIVHGEIYITALDCRYANAGRFSQAVVACKSQAVTKLKKKYLWSWAIAGVMIPLLLLLVGLFMPKPTEWNPFQEPKSKSSSTQVRSCRCVALAHRTCSGSPGPRGHRRWGRFGRSASFSDHNCSFTSSECCDLCGHWIDSLDSRGGIFPSLSKALAKLAQPSVDPCQLPISSNGLIERAQRSMPSSTASPKRASD